MNYYSEEPYARAPRVSDPKSPWNKHPHVGRDLQFEKPKPVTIFDVFPHLGRMTIGWSPILETLKEVTSTKPSYPPYDIVKINDITNVLNVAVAGFSKKELSVTVEDSILTIQGKKKDKPEGEILYQGIAARDFDLKLAVAEYWKVDSAEVIDGMLMVTFTKELPEEKKPKVVDIK